jgi:hypothetical protein
MRDLLRTTTCNWWGLQIEIYRLVLWTPGVALVFNFNHTILSYIFI